MMSLPLNAALGLVMILTLCFSAVDADDVLSSPVGLAGYPFIQMIQNSTQNLAATTVLVVVPLISLAGSVIAEIATASRQLWSFARDGGVPFSGWTAKVGEQDRKNPLGNRLTICVSPGQHALGNST